MNLDVDFGGHNGAAGPGRLHGGRVRVGKNKYGSVQELRSTFRQFYFVLVMFQLGSE